MGRVQHPQLRDLIWAVCSPSLIKPRAEWPAVFTLHSSAEIRQRLEHTDTRALQHHLAHCETRFLGSYFEALWEFFFLQEPRFEVIAKNLQIRDAHHTLGEFDFIIFDKHANKYLQLELAIKFYLGCSAENSHPYTDGKHLWIGPQARDRLDLKIARALEHQLTLHRHPLAQRQLQALGVDAVEPLWLFKGYLFQPHHALPLPDYIVDTNKHAHWVSLEQLPAVLNDDHPWQLLHKRHWPAPPYAENIDKPLTVNELVEQLNVIIKRENRPCLIIQTARTAASPQVLKRYFVTPAGWPHNLR